MVQRGRFALLLNRYHVAAKGLVIVGPVHVESQAGSEASEHTWDVLHWSAKERAMFSIL